MSTGRSPLWDNSVEYQQIRSGVQGCFWCLVIEHGKTHLLYIAQPVQQVCSSLRSRGVHRDAPSFQREQIMSWLGLDAHRFRWFMHLTYVTAAF